MYNRDKNCAIIIPHYNTPTALNRLLTKIPSHIHGQTLVIDDGSQHRPEKLPCPMISHRYNKAMQDKIRLSSYFAQKSFHITHIAMIHGDDQYSTAYGRLREDHTYNSVQGI